MDPAFLRRIPYKIEVDGPSEEEFTDIFLRVCAGRGVPATRDDATRVMEELAQQGQRLACYQAKFVVDQIAAATRYLGIKPKFIPQLVADAVANICAKSAAAERSTATASGSTAPTGSDMPAGATAQE
jgi:hypothetical protein